MYRIINLLTSNIELALIKTNLMLFKMRKIRPYIFNQVMTHPN